jgi:hemolysin activation/secretion protein
MRYCVLIVLFFIPLPVSAQNVTAAQTAPQVQGTLIHNITIDGFVLGDKNQFYKLFKPYLNKHLSTVDMDAILQQIQAIYEEGGYQSLVSIVYSVKKRHLIYTVSWAK